MISNAKLLIKTQIRNAVITRFYHTNRVNKVTLYSKISPIGNPNTSVVPELENWINGGNRVRFAELRRIIHDLRKRKRFNHALEVSEWMSKRGICVFTSSEHAVQLDLIGRIRGFVSAETYFNNLKDHDKTNKTYGALLNCYVRQRQTEKSLSHLQKMKELGFASSALTYNDIMCLYTKTGQYEKIPDILTEMKDNKVSPDNFSYRICINSYGVRSDIGGMEKILKEMERESHIVMDWNTYAVAANFYIKAGFIDKGLELLKKSEERLEKKDGTGYNFLISIYASLGNKSEVLRLWGFEKAACKRCINRDYITMLESLMKLNELNEATEVLKEWESSGNSYDPRVPNTIIIGYCKTGLYEKAESLILELREKGKATTPNSWAVIAAGYLNRNMKAKALDCMKAALSLNVKGKGWKPNPKLVKEIYSWLGDEGSVEEVEGFVRSLRGVIGANREMYNAMIKAYIRSGKEVEGILERMRVDKIDEDEETKEILGMRQKEL